MVVIERLAYISYIEAVNAAKTIGCSQWNSSSLTDFKLADRNLVISPNILTDNNCLMNSAGNHPQKVKHRR